MQRQKIAQIIRFIFLSFQKFRLCIGFVKIIEQKGCVRLFPFRAIAERTSRFFSWSVLLSYCSALSIPRMFGFAIYCGLNRKNFRFFLSENVPSVLPIGYCHKSETSVIMTDRFVTDPLSFFRIRIFRIFLPNPRLIKRILKRSYIAGSADIVYNEYRPQGKTTERYSADTPIRSGFQRKIPAYTVFSRRKHSAPAFPCERR